MDEIQLHSIIWFPHSGCRWLNRSLLNRHSKIETTEFFLPFLTHSTDHVLNLDRTAQVHKSRSDKELQPLFNIAKASIDHGREEAIKFYFNSLKLQFPEEKILVGALSPGAPEPLTPDLNTIVKAIPEMKVIHLVRNPIDCFLSMKSRMEMDGDPIKIASTWSGFNASIRKFGLNHPSKYHLIKYEDLKVNSKATLIELCKFLQVDFEVEMLTEKEEYHGRNKNSDLRKELTRDEKMCIVELCKVEASFYNYEIANGS